MNKGNLHELIHRYTENYDIFIGAQHDELFKWRAVQRFRSVWFSDDASSLSFAQLFDAARKESAVLIDNSQVMPTCGIVKMAEQRPKEVEVQFRDVLFSDDDGDIALRQEHMDQFLDGIEAIRQATFPKSWKYMQDRHSASCYLSFFAPEENYIYRYSDAEAFAKCIEYGRDIGAGSSFSLTNYYAMCEQIVAALREHDDLMAKYHAALDDSCYPDESLHLMAFDLQYCCRCYSLYSGLSFIDRRDALREYTLQQEKAMDTAERAERCAALDQQIDDIGLRLSMYDEIALVGVDVTQKAYGVGRINHQDGNHITVQFANCTKEFVIHRKYMQRPTFENDDEIVAIYTEMADLNDELKRLQKERLSLMA